MPIVSFLPSGLRTSCVKGDSILDLVRTLGLGIRNDCGGDGACGKCLVIIQQGKVDVLAGGKSLPAGQYYACRSRVADTDLLVEIPLGSAEVAGEVELEAVGKITEPVPAVAASPIITEIRVDLPEPGLDDNRADVERLLDVLEAELGMRPKIGLICCQNVAGILRESNWKVKVSIADFSDSPCVVALGPADAKTGLTLALDIGTTTVVGKLLGGATEPVAACYNSQISFGPDIITRIIQATDKPAGAETLARLIRSDIERIAQKLLADAGRQREDIRAVVAAGNTTMVHLLLQLPAAGIRKEPYCGVTTRPEPVTAGAIGLALSPEVPVCCLPGVAGFVGGDIVAGVIASKIYEAEGIKLFIDFGTNGEIVVGNKDFLLCASASAGPAFEGGATDSGMRAGNGAIDKVSISETGELVFNIIGEKKAKGICGTGYVDLLACLLQLKLVDRFGRFTPEAEEKVIINDFGEKSFVLIESENSAVGRHIEISEPDIANLVRSKAAIFAAAEVLLTQAGLDWDALDEVLVAGGFGMHLNPQSAALIGLLPEMPSEKVNFVGNTSLAGALAVARDKSLWQFSQELSVNMAYFELSTEPSFTDHFVAASFLPHTDLHKFPLAAQLLEAK